MRKDSKHMPHWVGVKGLLFWTGVSCLTSPAPPCPALNLQLERCGVYRVCMPDMLQHKSSHDPYTGWINFLYQCLRNAKVPPKVVGTSIAFCLTLIPNAVIYSEFVIALPKRYTTSGGSLVQNIHSARSGHRVRAPDQTGFIQQFNATTQVESGHD